MNWSSIRVGDIPRLSKAGWLRLKKWARSLKPQTGRLLTPNVRAAHRINSEASQHL
jgi:hypothetical protein